MNASVKFPTVPDDLSSIVKPEELVDIVEVTPLTLQDRRIYNMLLANAWNDIHTREKHTINRKQLVQYVNSHNQDVMASLQRLMMAVVQIYIRNNQNGEPAIRQIALLGSNETEIRGTRITYDFPVELVKIIKNTQIFARLHTKVMFELSSKYSLSLYEFLQRRKNLRHLNHEILSLEQVRGLLGVPAGKLTLFGNLNNKAIKPAIQEVSFLTEYEISAEPIRQGRAVTHIKFAWSKKTDIGAQITAVEELERSRVGRKSRMRGTVDTLEAIETSAQKSNSLPSEPKILLSSGLLEKGRVLALEASTGWDIHAIEQQFMDFIKTKGKPNNLEAAFLGFVRKKVKSAP